MKRAIITGPTGVIGSALTKELISHGIEVLLITNPNSKRNAYIIQDTLISILPCSIDEYSKLENVTGKKMMFFIILHGSVRWSHNDKISDFRNAI